MTAVLAGAAWLFGGITQDVVEDDGIARSDARLLNDVVDHRNAVLTPLAKIVTILGTGVVLYGVLAVLGFCCGAEPVVEPSPSFVCSGSPPGN